MTIPGQAIVERYKEAIALAMTGTPWEEVAERLGIEMRELMDWRSTGEWQGAEAVLLQKARALAARELAYAALPAAKLVGDSVRQGNLESATEVLRWLGLNTAPDLGHRLSEGEDGVAELRQLEKASTGLRRVK